MRAIVTWAGSPMSEEVAAPGQRAFDELRAYCAELVAKQRENPSDNLLGEIVRAHLEEGGFSVDACTVAVVSLLLGGLETTIQMLSATVASLLVRAALDALLDRFPRIRLERPVEFSYGARGFVQHGTEELPVLLT